MSSHVQPLSRDEDGRVSNLVSSYQQLMINQNKRKISRTQGALIRKLDTFCTLEDDWNGYEAVPIHREAMESAFQFVVNLSSTKEYRQLDIFPVPNGHVQIELERGHTYLEFEFREDGQVDIFSMEGDQEKEVTRLFDQSCIDDMIRELQKAQAKRLSKKAVLETQ